jgi:hypothetical protein
VGKGSVPQKRGRGCQASRVSVLVRPAPDDPGGGPQGGELVQDYRRAGMMQVNRIQVLLCSAMRRLLYVQLYSAVMTLLIREYLLQPGVLPGVTGGDT